ncbi:MAG: class I SAM-dependent methyltransferase, partial [Anaerolineales bacterium]
MPVAWYRAVFNQPAYLHLYEQMDRRTAPAEATGAAKLLRLRPGERVLDLACGYGRHVAELERQGFRAFGVDLADGLLRRAAEHAAHHALAMRYARADLRALPFGPVFDAAASFFLSFGYL